MRNRRNIYEGFGDGDDDEGMGFGAPELDHGKLKKSICEALKDMYNGMIYFAQKPNADPIIRSSARQIRALRSLCNDMTQEDFYQHVRSYVYKSFMQFGQKLQLTNNEDLKAAQKLKYAVTYLTMGLAQMLGDSTELPSDLKAYARGVRLKNHIIYIKDTGRRPVSKKTGIPALSLEMYLETDEVGFYPKHQFWIPETEAKNPEAVKQIIYTEYQKICHDNNLDINFIH